MQRLKVEKQKEEVYYEKAIFMTLGVLVLVIPALLIAVPVVAGGFVHAPVVTVGGVDYYLAGPPDGLGGANDGRSHSVYRDKLGEFSSLLTDFLG